MLNVVELFQIGDLEGLVVGLEQLELVVKMLARNIREESKCSLEEYLCLRSQKFEMNETGTGRNLEIG